MSRPIYTRHVNGRFHKLRAAVSLILQSLLFVLPWIEYHGRPFLLLDIPHRRLYLGHLVLFPQETFFLLIMLLSAGTLLFLSTSLGGRIWCGYACPQTLFSQSFMMIERWVEGDRARRMRREKGSLTASWVIRRGLKLAIWLVMGIWLGITISGYFVPIRQLTLASWPVVAFFTFISLLDFGFLREMVCHNWCPYARFQGALFDKDTLVIAYDNERGEPRGKVNTTQGSCVDCSLCVQVCPMGIDIRDGQQLECIACAACIDACDQVMDKLKRPRGLVGYRTLSGRQRLLRPRTIVYGVVLAVLATTFLYLATHRQLLAVDVVRSAALFNTTPDGRVSNNYTVHLINRRDEPVEVKLSLEGMPEGELISPRGNPVTVPPASVQAVQVLVVRPKADRPVVSFRLKANDEEVQTTFVGPGQ